MQKFNPLVRACPRSGTFLQSGRSSFPGEDRYQTTEAGTQLPAGKGRYHCPEGTGGAGGELRTAPAQRLHHADGVSAQPLRDRPGSGHGMGTENLCRLRRRHSRNLPLVLPADRGIRYTVAQHRKGQCTATAGRRGGDRGFSLRSGFIPPECHYRQV